MIFSKLPKGAREAFDNQVAVIDSMNRVSDSDIIVISFDKDKDEKNIPYTRERKEEMNKAGDYSYIQKMLMKRVYDGSKPFYTTYNFNGQERTNYYYKAINAWGDSFRLQEYYSQPKQSKVDNGFHKIDIEFSDSEIRDIITDKPVITSVPVTPAPVEVPAGEGFQGYKSGFSIKGRGTPEGDGKDQAMRQVAHGVITELANPPKWLNKDNTVRRSAKKGDSSSATSIIQVVRKEEKEHGGDNIYNPVVTSKGNTYAVAARSMESPVYMLARNSEFSGKPLDENTKFVINAVKDRFNATFVVGDQPGVDSPFIDYLKEIGATFTIYHAGPEGTSRTKVEDKGAFPDKPLDIQPGQCG